MGIDEPLPSVTVVILPGDKDLKHWELRLTQLN